MHRRYASLSAVPPRPFNYINLYLHDCKRARVMCRLNDMEKTIWKEAERLAIEERKGGGEERGGEERRASFIACKKKKKRKKESL